MDELTKTKVNNLIALRQLITQVLTVLTGGLVGVFLMPNTAFKIFLLIFGIYFTAKLIATLANTITELNSYLYSNKRKGGKI